MNSVIHSGSQTGPAQSAVRKLRRFAQIERIYLFGSPRSDIDLAIACPGANARVWADICEAVDGADTLLKIDVVRLDEAAPELAGRILTEGRLLYERR